MDFLKQFATDQTAEERGVWRDVGDGARLLIARKDNKHYRRVLRDKIRGMEQQMRMRVLPEDIQLDILCQSTAETILLGWEGLEENGETVAYSKIQALKWLIGFKDFRELVEALSEDIEAYRIETLQSTEKNSGRSSGSASKTTPKK